MVHNIIYIMTLYNYLMCTFIHVPIIGGPMTDAIPWNSSNNPKALVSLSRPKRSTKTTDVRPT